MEDYYEKLKKMTVEELDVEKERLMKERDKLEAEQKETIKIKESSERLNAFLEVDNKIDEIDRKMILLVRVLLE